MPYVRDQLTRRFSFPGYYLIRKNRTSVITQVLRDVYMKEGGS